LTLKSRAFCARASLLTEARKLVNSLLIRVTGGPAGTLTGFGGRGAVMVENLGLVGEESFAAIGANRETRVALRSPRAGSATSAA
jgi:hypothetical protein